MCKMRSKHRAGPLCIAYWKSDICLIARSYADTQKLSQYSGASLIDRERPVTSEYLQEFTMAVRRKRRGDAEEVVMVMKRRCIMVVVKRNRSEL